MNSKERSDQIFGGSFLIGLAILFITGYWWPGIMFVIGISMLLRTINQGKSWASDHSALIVLGIGVVFGLPIFTGNWLPLLFIALGVYVLFGDEVRGYFGKHDSRESQRSEKSKNDML